jgi:hypothetical protein
MNNIHITTRKKLKGVEPTNTRRVGFLWLTKRYEYNFVSPALYRQVLCANRDVKIDGVNAVTGGIIKGQAV